jgi:hypothetical protein
MRARRPSGTSGSRWRTTARSSWCARVTDCVPIGCYTVPVSVYHVCCLARRSAPRAWPRVRGGGCRSGGRRSAGRRGRRRGGGEERRGGPARPRRRRGSRRHCGRAWRGTCRNIGQRAGRTPTPTPNTLTTPNATRNAPSIQQSNYSSARSTEYIEQARSGQRNR